jgi:hypothetical protein
MECLQEKKTLGAAAAKSGREQSKKTREKDKVFDAENG